MPLRHAHTAACHYKPPCYNSNLEIAMKLKRDIMHIVVIVVTGFLLGLDSISSLSITTTEEPMSSRYFQEHKQVTVNVNELAGKYLQEAKTAYQMSMPLLANPKHYTNPKIAEQFKTLLAEGKEGLEFGLWMKGRQLLIAMHASQEKEAARIAADLRPALTSTRYAPTQANYSENTAFAGWALGYLLSYYALHNKSAYEANKAALQAAVQYQHGHYEPPLLNSLPSSGEREIKASLSNVMWTYAMAIQAAALAKDSQSYTNYMQGLATLSGPNGTVAISIRNLGNAEFPAWLASIVYNSAQRMQDPQATAIQHELARAMARTTQEQDRMLSVATTAPSQINSTQQLEVSNLRSAL